MNYSFGQVREIPKDVDKTRTIPFIISSGKRDRHRSVVNMKNWVLDRYNKNPIVGYMHDLYGGNPFLPDDPDTAIGYSSVSIEKEFLIGRVTFETASINPLAEKIFKKVKFGSIRAASVGFLEVGKGKYGSGDEVKGGSNETYYFQGQELLEWSIVKIPSNSEATIQNQASPIESKMKMLDLRLKYDNPRFYGEYLLDKANELKLTDPKKYRELRIEGLKYINQ